MVQMGPNYQAQAAEFFEWLDSMKTQMQLRNIDCTPKP